MRKYILDIFYLFLGNFLLAISVSMFILPSNVLSGGVAGIAVLLKPFISLPQTTVITMLIYALFVIGWFFLGNHFAMTTLLSTLLYPILLELCSWAIPAQEMDPMMASIFGGFIGGIGIGIVMRRGASTGGMDIPPLIIHKYLHVDLFKAVMFIDGLTVLSGLFVYDLEHVLMGLVTVYSTSLAIDKMITFGSQAIMSVQIITREYDKISENIQLALGRGVTLFEAEGGYTHEKKKVVFVVIGKRQFQTLCDVVEQTDPSAFLIASNAQEVHGNGFSIGSKI